MSKVQNQLKIFSFNILRDYNPLSIRRSIKESLKKYDFDLLLFQEITIGQFNQISLLDEEFLKDYNYFFIPIELRKIKDIAHNNDLMGVGIFSKIPFEKEKSYFLPNVKTFKDNTTRITERCSGYVQLKIGDKKVGVYSIHLENATKAYGRELQTQYFLEQIKENKEDDITIIGGDFNGRQTSLFETYWKIFKEQGFTDPYHNDIRILPRLDRFFIKGVKKIEKLKVKGNGSDHQPIGVKIEF